MNLEAYIAWSKKLKLVCKQTTTQSHDFNITITKFLKVYLFIYFFYLQVEKFE